MIVSNFHIKHRPKQHAQGDERRQRSEESMNALESDHNSMLIKIAAKLK